MFVLLDKGQVEKNQSLMITEQFHLVIFHATYSGTMCSQIETDDGESWILPLFPLDRGEKEAITMMKSFNLSWNSVNR